METFTIDFIADNDFYHKMFVVKNNGDIWKHIEKLDEMAENGQPIETMSKYLADNCEIIPNNEYYIYFTNK